MQPIHSSDLCLRLFVPGDAAAFAMAARESAASVGRWMPWCHSDYTPAEAELWFAVCTQGIADKSAFEFGIFSGDGDQLLGGAGLNQINKQHNFCNLGYWVRASRQGLGIATRTVKMLSEFGFSTLGLTRIEIVVAQGNEPSIAVAKKAGAVYECLARNRLVIRGAPVAASVYALVP